MQMKEAGLTLVELIVAVAIVAILAAIALPSYNDSIRKSRRGDVQKDLMEFAATAERIFTETNSYATLTKPADTSYYTFTLTPSSRTTTYTIQAVPTAAQSEDSCKTLTLLHTGYRQRDPDAADSCNW